jgi:Ribonucleotide reductase, alpha subunit
MVRALDNAVEISIKNYHLEEQKTIMKAKRKIGIGICGLADLFIQCGISYADQKARDLAQDIVAFISYHSKVASHELARARGSFGAMAMDQGCRYNENPGYIEQVSGKIATKHVSKKMWLDLAHAIRTTKLLRNASTVALPPTGRSAILANASWAIEPLFSLVGGYGSGKSLNPYLEKALSDASLLNTELKKKS